MKPIIFLDFDGVFNSVETAIAWGNPDKLDPRAVGLVQSLTENTDAEVVISSTWRKLMTLQDIQQHLRAHGGNSLAARVVATTPSVKGNVVRGIEIAQWLTAWRPVYTPYVIIDDDSDMLDSQLPHFVQVPNYRGFGLPEYVKACDILGHASRDLEHFKRYLEIQA